MAKKKKKKAAASAAARKKKAVPRKAAPKARAGRLKLKPPRSGVAKGRSAPAKPKGRRAGWLDPKSNVPMIDQYARRLSSFIATMEDGEVDDRELAAQEARLVDLMKDVEPQLDAALHEKVTRLLCELTAYDIMQMLNAMQAQRPKTVFRG